MINGNPCSVFAPTVTVGVTLMPIPGGLDNRLDVVVACFPTQNLFGKSCIGNQLGWIARPSLTDDLGNRMPSDFTASLNDFTDTGSLAQFPGSHRYPLPTVANAQALSNELHPDHQHEYNREYTSRLVSGSRHRKMEIDFSLSQGNLQAQSESGAIRANDLRRLYHRGDAPAALK